MHARVYGRAPLSRETVIGGEPLGQEVRTLLVAHPPPLGADEQNVVPGLRATYGAQEQAAITIAVRLDDG